MKKQLAVVLAGVTFILGSAVTHTAQTGKAFKIEIPFVFLISDQTFPAGTYSVGRLTDQNPTLLFIRSGDGKRKIAIVTHKVSTKEPLSKSMLSFIQYRNTFFLTSIWTSNEMYGNKLSMGNWKRTPEMATESKVINLFEAERR